MESKTSFNRIKKNVSLAILAQAFSLGVSFVINLIVPKFISEQQYAYWQMYVLYVGYVGILHFGLLDGIVLRYSQYDYDQLDKRRICSQFKLLLTVTSTIALFILAGSSFVLSNQYRDVALFVALGIVTRNVVTYTTYLLQITNRISKYVTLTILHRVSFGALSLFLLVVKVDHFQWFCMAEILSEVGAVLLGVYYSKELYISKSISLQETLIEAKHNVSSGVLLLIANWSSMLIVGSAKMVVQFRWSDLMFGKVSFAFSLANLFLTFINAISVVLFPALKRMNSQQLPSLYEKLRDTISPVLFGALLLYFPGCWILEKWLPQYQPSLTYLGYLLPMIVFASKVSLLTNNYLKAYRKEGLMLYVNIGCVVSAIVMYIVAAYLFDNLVALLITVILAVMLRSVISETVVAKVINKKFYKEFALEMLITALFIACTQCFARWIGMAVYFCIFLCYLALYVTKKRVKKIDMRIEQ